MPVHVTTDTNQTISGDKTFTGLVSSQSGFVFSDGTTQTTAFTGGFMSLSGGYISGDATINGTLSVATLCALSANIDIINITRYELSGFEVEGDFTVNGTISSANAIYAENGNSEQWNDVYAVVQTNSATTWNYQGTDVKALTSNWQSSYTSLTSTSANWNDTRSVVQTNSAAWAVDNTTDTEVRSLTSNWQNSYTALTSTSANWNDTHSTVQANSAQWATDNSTDTDVRALTANWQNSYSTVQSNSATSWNYQGTDVKALTSNWQSSYTSLTSTSADWNNTKNIVQNNSATTWNYQGTDIKTLTANWQSSYTALTSTSGDWNDTRSTVQTNSALWAVDNTTDTGVRALTSNWQNSYTALTSTSGDWNDTRNIVQTNSATIWNYQGTDVKALTSNWQGSYTALTSTSADWNNAKSTVQANSAQWATDNSTDTDVRALTSNWENTYTSFSTQSANNASVYSTVQTNSADAWNYQGTDVKSLTSNWQSTYSTVQSNSATWGTGGGGGDPTDLSYTRWQLTGDGSLDTFSIPGASTDVEAAFRVTIDAVIQDPASYTVDSSADTIVFSSVPQLSSNIVIIETQTQASQSLTVLAAASGDWNSTYSTVQSNSATWANDIYNEIWIGAGAMISPTLSGAESTTLPITGGGNEIYVDAFNFDAASIEYAQFSFLPPTNCNRESFKCQFSWTASTTGNAAWNIQAASLDDSNAIDIAWGNAQEAIDYANDSTTFQLTTATNTISPSGTTDSNSMLLFRAYRDVNSVNDTLAVDASLLGIRMQYLLNGGLSAAW